MKQKIFSLLILLLGVFLLFYPQTSRAVSCKCTTTVGGSPTELGCTALKGPDVVGGYTTESDPTDESPKTCDEYKTSLIGDVVSGYNILGLNSNNLACQTYNTNEECLASLAPTTPAPSAGEGTVNIDSGLLGSYTVDLNKKPLLEINIPGLNFSDVTSSSDENGTYFYIAWIPELISALYKFGLAIVSIVAVVVIIIQGLRVITSGGGEGKTAAYKKIFQAIVGLFIAWGSYAILYNINPALVQFNALKVKVIEGEQLDDESSANIPEETDTTAAGGGTGVIGSLIGAYPSQFAACSKEGAQYAAKKLYDASVCVGPCNCAWTASYFLNYIGCTNIKDGNTTNLESKLVELGWIRKTLTKDRKNLPVGLLVMHGHVGVSIGDGKQFQSVPGNKIFVDLNKRGGGNCSTSGKATYADPSGCGFCTKVPALRPVISQGNTKGWDTRCARNQAWDLGDIWSNSSGRGWTEIIYPPS